MRVELAGLGGLTGRQRNLERARHAHDRDVVGPHPRRRERSERALLQAIGDEVVVLRDDHRELQSAGRLAAFDGPHLPSLERRLAFLEERACAFPHVVGRRDQPEQRRLVHAAVGKRHVASLVDRIEDVPHGDRRLGRERRGERTRRDP